MAEELGGKPGGPGGWQLKPPGSRYRRGGRMGTGFGPCQGRGLSLTAHTQGAEVPGFRFVRQRQGRAGRDFLLALPTTRIAVSVTAIHRK